MGMETVEELTNIKVNPGENYLQDLNSFHKLLLDLSPDDRHVIILVMVELGYRAKSPKAIANIVSFLENSFSMPDNEREQYYKELSQTLFGG